MEVLIFVIWLALCGVAAYIAENRGRSGVGLFFLSLFLSPLVGIIVAFSLRPNVEKVAIAQGKKKCPNCAEFVQPDAKACRFCQHSFVEEETAERARLEAEQARLETERAAAAAQQHAEYEAFQAAEAAKPWIRRYAEALTAVAVVVCIFGGVAWYSATHPMQPVKLGENKPAAPAIPTWAREERSKVPKSVWDRKVAWAVEHHCYFRGMSRDEIVEALGRPTEEASYDLTYKRQTKDCTRYDGDACAEYKTEEQTIWVTDGYTDPRMSSRDDGCRTLFGEHQWVGLPVPNFALSKAAH